jgi:hypothetical protein
MTKTHTLLNGTFALTEILESSPDTVTPDSPETGTEAAALEQSSCAHDGPTRPDPMSGLTPDAVFLAIVHTNGLTDELPTGWQARFQTWWEMTGGNLAMIRHAVDAAVHTIRTGLKIPNLCDYLHAAIHDIHTWIAGADENETWDVTGFEARTLGAILNNHAVTDPGAYTHPLHQHVHLALTTAPEPTVTGVYGELCRTGAMGHPAAPYTLAHLKALEEGGTAF